MINVVEDNNITDVRVVYIEPPDINVNHDEDLAKKDKSRLRKDK